jgi:hypothetical protein
MAQQINIVTYAAGITGFVFEDGFAGKGGMSFRVSVSETGVEYYSPLSGATTPLEINDGVISLIGLSSVGPSNAVIGSTGSELEWVTATGSGSVVRANGATLGETIISSLQAGDIGGGDYVVNIDGEAARIGFLGGSSYMLVADPSDAFVSITDLRVSSLGMIDDGPSKITNMGSSTYVIRTDTADGGKLGFFGSLEVKQSLSITSVDPAVSEIQNLLFSYGLAENAL